MLMQNRGWGQDKQDVLWELESSEYQVYLNSLPRHGFPYLYLIRGHKIIKKVCFGIFEGVPLDNKFHGQKKKRFNQKNQIPCSHCEIRKKALRS